MRPNRPWPYWYEVRIEYRGLIRLRPRFWWLDLFTLPFQVWLGQRAERALYEVIPPDVLREVMIQWKETQDDEM